MQEPEKKAEQPVFPPTTPHKTNGTRRRKRKGLRAIGPRRRSSSRSPDRSSERTGSRRRTYKKWRRRVLVALPIILLILLIDGVYAVLTLSNSLQAAADHLEDGSSAARASDFATAEDEFDQALDEASSAVTTSNHPSPVIATWLPVVGDDAQTVRNLARG